MFATCRTRDVFTYSSGSAVHTGAAVSGVPAVTGLCESAHLLKGVIVIIAHAEGASVEHKKTVALSHFSKLDIR